MIHERDGETDRRTDRHCMTAKTALASHRAIKMMNFSNRWFLVLYIFLLFINDLPSLFDDGITVKIFAHDVKIHLVVNDINNSSVLCLTSL